MLRVILALALMAGSIKDGVAQRRPGRDPREPLLADLRNLVTAQEMFFADSVRYSKSLSTLAFVALSGARMELNEARSTGWSAVGQLPGDTLMCGIYVGAVTPPFTAPMREGFPSCFQPRLRFIPADTLGRGTGTIASLPGINQAAGVGEIVFRSNGSELRPDRQATLDHLADLLMSAPANARWEIGVHSDNLGSERERRQWSNDRGSAVVAYLIGRGVPHSSIQYYGYASDSPVSPNTTANGRAANRRIEVRRLQ